MKAKLTSTLKKKNLQPFVRNWNGNVPNLKYLRTNLEKKRLEVEQLLAEKEVLLEKVESIQRETSSNQVLLSTRNQQLQQIRLELGKALVDLEASQTEASNSKREYLNIYSSLSYQITSPLRFLYVLFHKIFRRNPDLNKHLEFENEMTISTTSSIPRESNLSEVKQHFTSLFLREIDNRKKNYKGKS